MGRIFGKTTVCFRLKCYFTDTFSQIFSLPSYINPKPLQPTELSEEERELANGHYVLDGDDFDRLFEED